jgi:hypothetical protein
MSQPLEYNKEPAFANASSSASDDGKAGSPDEYLEKIPQVPAVLPVDVAKIEESKGPAGYEPANDEERALDRRLNLKLDFIVLPILSINYALAGLDKNSLGESKRPGRCDTALNCSARKRAHRRLHQGYGLRS